jgi:hypothetical protein
MTTINFDEASVGEVNRESAFGLQVRMKGRGSQAFLAHALDSNDEENPQGGAGAVAITERAGGNGIWSESRHAKGSAGITAITHGARAPGVHGESRHELGGAGVLGICRTKWAGVQGQCGVAGGMGVFAESIVDNGLGLLARATTAGVAGRGLAGRFEGDVEVTGDIRVLNADCAEDFDVADSKLEKVEAGTVMVLTENGSLQPSYQEYDKKVAGVISGAGGYKPGIVLDTHHREEEQEQESDNDAARRRMPVALVGKVYCKVDATLSAVEVGDLLTTSSTEGHAMKASDPINAFGTVIGKALRPLREGRGLIPILIALQ